MPRVRTEDEFKAPLTITAPPHKLAITEWDLERIRVARDAQMRGQFDLPVRLAEAMRTDTAMFNAYHNRLRAQSAIPAKLVAAPGARGAAIARKAEASVFIAKSVLKGLYGTLANHGIAIGKVVREPNEDGTRVDFRLVEWPLEFVRWRQYENLLVTMTREGILQPIVHGDGEWVIFRKFNDRPWTQDACLLPGALCWAAHANGIANWAAASRSHGQAKIIGELPAGISLAGQNADGTPAGMSPEAFAFLQMLQDVVLGDAGVGIRPAGAKTDFLANGSTAWQVFDAFTTNRERAAMRIYNGTDAALGSTGDAPGIDIAQLFGISDTAIEDDLDAIEQALRTGVYEPWCAVNEGTSQYAPALIFQYPDPDAAKEEEQRRKKRADLLALCKEYTAQGFVLDQATIDSLAAELGVTNPPALAVIAAKATSIPLASQDVAKVVRVNEARASLGLPAITGPSGEMTVSQLDQQTQIDVARIKADASVGAKAKPTPDAPPAAP